MNWYLVHTKPRQEEMALRNLQVQNYECYLPTLPKEKISQQALTLVDQPLFPRYLFIRLGIDFKSQSWSPIRSTPGVSRLVRFGLEPAKVDDDLLRLHAADDTADDVALATGELGENNLALGLPQPLHHDEVMETAARVKGQFIALLEGVVERL